MPIRHRRSDTSRDGTDDCFFDAAERPFVAAIEFGVGLLEADDLAGVGVRVVVIGSMWESAYATHYFWGFFGVAGTGEGEVEVRMGRSTATGGLIRLIELLVPI
jgi:hypothetical protein